MAQRLFNPAPQFFYTGTPAAPLSGGLMYFYEPGSDTPKDTYSDNALSVANSNPVVLSASGVMPNVFLEGSYKVVLTDKNGVQQPGWPRDNVNSVSDMALSDWSPTVEYDAYGTNIVFASDGNYYISIQDGNIAHDPPVSPLWWDPWPPLFTGGSLTSAMNYARATVASHATTADIWSADGNQINWTGTATTTAFPAAPQAGSQRQLFCAAACAFTAGPNLLIQGVSSGSTFTCAANDKVTVDALTTTQFQLTIEKYNGTAVAGAGNHEVIVTNGNGMGSVGTRIRRFSVTQTAVGTAITYADSATDGATFTINEDGIYAMTYQDLSAAGSGSLGISLNSNQLSTAIISITAANALVFTREPGGALPGAVSYTKRLSAGDVIRAHDGAAFDDTSSFVKFSIRKIAS